MADEKYSAQKKYLESKKQLRVWVDPEAYDAFKSKCEANGESVYSVINRFIREYTSESVPQSQKE